jgi:hypothetical protein
LIHVAGVPLLGINLKACLAGIETMLKYGIWQDWDEAQRSIATRERQQKRVKEQINTPGSEPEGNLISSLDSEIAAKFLNEEEVKI